MDFCHSFEHIDLNIFYEPTTAINTITQQTITNEELDSIIELKTREDTDTTSILDINFPMGYFNVDFCDDVKLIETTIKIPKLFTLRQLLTLIYNFYKEPLLSGESITNPIYNISQSRITVLKKIKQKIINYNLDKDPFYDASNLKNINVFTDVKMPKFCGITFNKYTIEHTVLIKL